MDLIETKGDIIQNFTGIENADGCTDKCQKNPNCSVWTFMDGVCYMKNEKTFLIRTTSNRLFSGMKDCDGTGIQFIFLIGITAFLKVLNNSFIFDVEIELLCFSI